MLEHCGQRRHYSVIEACLLALLALQAIVPAYMSSCPEICLRDDTYDKHLMIHLCLEEGRGHCIRTWDSAIHVVSAVQCHSPLSVLITGLAFVYPTFQSLIAYLLQCTLSTMAGETVQPMWVSFRHQESPRPALP